MKMVVARLAGAVMASSLNQNKFWTRCCCDGGIKPAPSPLGRWSCVSIPSLEWLSRLVPSHPKPDWTNRCPALPTLIAGLTWPLTGVALRCRTCHVEDSCLRRGRLVFHANSDQPTHAHMTEPSPTQPNPAQPNPAQPCTSQHGPLQP